MSPENTAEKLSKALKDNDCVQIESLIANGVDVNQIDAEGTRPLRHVAETGCMHCLTLLLNYGADIGTTATMNAPSAVSIAASNDHTDVLKCLLDNCVDESIINGEKEKQPPLHYACSRGKIDTLRYIVERYPRVVYSKASVGAKRCTSLHAAARNDNVECMEVLLGHGVGIGVADTDGATA